MIFYVLYTILAITCVPLYSHYSMPYAPYYSQEGQDKYVVEKLFNHKKHGVFVDIGAHDGVSFSNTYYLEKELNWTGICVEPQKKMFEQLAKNRSCICIEGCIFTSSGTKDFLQVNGPSDMLSGLLETYDPRHLDRAKKEVAQRGGSLEILHIEAYTFNDICKKYGIDHVDFLSIDTEGSEELIIKSIDFDTIDITVLAVENNYRDNHVKEHLVARGYKLDRVLGGDEIYVKIGNNL